LAAEDFDYGTKSVIKKERKKKREATTIGVAEDVDS
jgi:hypothetical protein